MTQVNELKREWGYAIVRIVIDYAAAILILALLWWLMVIIWLAVRILSPGPGIFSQSRVGRNEAVFTCYKFRTMSVSAPNLGTHDVSAAMVTPFGAFLRRTKLDELPQVINVLFNQMSLVGPRPCLPIQIELIYERRTRGVFRVKPGITGLAQIEGVDMSDPVKLAKLDQQYIEQRSLALDIKILAATALGRGSGDKIKS